LPRSQRTQIDWCQTCPGDCADTNEEGVDVSNAELPIGRPKDNGPEEWDYQTKTQAKGGQDRAILEVEVWTLTRKGRGLGKSSDGV